MADSIEQRFPIFSDKVNVKHFAARWVYRWLLDGVEDEIEMCQQRLQGLSERARLRNKHLLDEMTWLQQLKSTMKPCAEMTAEEQEIEDDEQGHLEIRKYWPDNIKGELCEKMKASEPMLIALFFLALLAEHDIYTVETATQIDETHPCFKRLTMHPKLKERLKRRLRIIARGETSPVVQAMQDMYNKALQLLSYDINTLVKYTPMKAEDIQQKKVV